MNLMLKIRLNSDLYEELNRVFSNGSDYFYTKDEDIYRLLLEHKYDVKFIPKEDFIGAHNIEHEILKHAHAKPEIHKIHKYTDIISEAKAILDFIAKNPNKKYLIATNNKFLEVTLNSLCRNYLCDKYEKIKRIWTSSAECLFRLNNGFYSNLCHSNAPHLPKFGNEESLGFRDIFKKFREHTKAFDYHQQYPIKDFFEIHKNFVATVFGDMYHELKDFTIDLHKKVSVYEYCSLIHQCVETKYPCQMKYSNKINMVPVRKIPWIDTPEILWIAGATNTVECNYKYLNLTKNIPEIYVSYSEFQDSIKCSRHNYFKDYKQIVDKTDPKESMIQRYSSPCPSLDMRNKSFAINHITKMLNNPYSFYIESILGIKQLKFHQNHIFGIAIHSIFESYIKNNPNTASFDEMKRRIDSIIEEHKLSKREIVMIRHKIYTMCKSLLPILRTSVELYPELEGAQEILHKNTKYMLHGRADLVYKDSEGRYGVIDFKTGSPPSWMNILNGISPQMAVEILMLKFGGFIKEEEINLAPSGFISPKGFFKITSEDLMIQSAIRGIKMLINIFWNEKQEYTFSILDENYPYQVLARSY